MPRLRLRITGDLWHDADANPEKVAAALAEAERLARSMSEPLPAGWSLTGRVYPFRVTLTNPDAREGGRPTKY